MQAYIDESEAQGQRFVFAGFIGSADAWTTFADRWDASCKQAPELERFKFYDFARHTGQFSPRRLSDDARTRRVSGLVATMAGLGFIRISVTIGLPRFSEMTGDTWPGIELAIPYCYGFQIITVAAAQELLDRGLTGEKLEMIFDEHMMFGHKAQKWYPLIRELCVGDELRAIMPEAPTFRTDDTAAPLQAADLYAGLVRSGNGEQSTKNDAMVSRLLVALSEIGVPNVMHMRAHAQKVRTSWDQVLGPAFSATDAAATFAPLVAHMKKCLRNIGGDRHSEEMLAPLFEAAQAVAQQMSAPDGFQWLRQELAETTLMSGNCKHLFEKTYRQELEEALNRYRIAPDPLGPNSFQRPVVTAPGLPDETLSRAIALLHEPSLDAFRSKLAKKKRGRKHRKRRT